MKQTKAQLKYKALAKDLETARNELTSAKQENNPQAAKIAKVSILSLFLFFIVSYI